MIKSPITEYSGIYGYHDVMDTLRAYFANVQMEYNLKALSCLLHKLIICTNLAVRTQSKVSVNNFHKGKCTRVQF